MQQQQQEQQQQQQQKQQSYHMPMNDLIHQLTLGTQMRLALLIIRLERHRYRASGDIMRTWRVECDIGIDTVHFVSIAGDCKVRVEGGGEVTDECALWD